MDALDLVAITCDNVADVGRRRGSAGGDPIELCELGPLEVRVGGASAPIRGERAITVVALLSIAGSAGVRTAELVDAAWPVPQPASARRSLANTVFRLRSQFGDAFVETTAGGYRLGQSVCSDRAVTLSAAAEIGAEDLSALDPSAAGAALRSVDAAVRRWRGTPWIDVSIVDVEADRAQLAAARLALLRARAQLLEMLGRVDEAVATVEDVIALDPGQDHDWSALARTLAAAGRRADAVAGIGRARRSAARRGLEIGVDLVALEHSLLEGASGVDPGVGGTADGGAAVHARGVASLTSIVGRDETIDRLLELVEDRSIVTIVGPGGVGKTRLAQEVVARLPSRSPVFVDLVPVRDGGFVVDAVLAALGADTDAATSRLDAAVASLAQRPRVVVLDNCEQVVDAVAALVPQLAARCGDTRFVATSRQPLGCRGEFMIELHPLDTEEDGPATDLFFERAAEAGVALDEVRWRSTVAELCRQLDGLPLAIELAARRSPMMSPAEMIEGLGDRFALLRRASGTDRHAALHTALAWSWDLLDEPDRAVLGRLAAFASGVDVDQLGAALQLDHWAALDAVERLRARSLVYVSKADGEPSRVHLLESVRVLATDKAADRGEWSACRAAHLEWVDEFTVRTVGPHGQDLDIADPLARLDREANEIRAAIERAEQGAQASCALAMCARLINWWRGRDHAPYAIEQLERLLEMATADDVVAVEAMATLVLMRRIGGAHIDEVRDTIDATGRRLDRIADPRVRDRLELRFWEGAFDVDEPTIAERLDALIARAHERDEAVDSLAFHLLGAWCLANDPARSRLVAERGAAVSGSTLARQAHMCELDGLAALAAGDPAGARPILRDALRRFGDIGQRFCEVHGCESVAWWLAAIGERDASATLLADTEGLRIAHRRHRSGFEEPAVHAAVELLGGRPEPNLDASLEATIVRARAGLDRK